MKKILFIIVSLTIFYSCKSSKSSLVNVSKDDYVLAYKTSVLYGCLSESTNEDFQKIMKENDDLGLAIESEILGKIEVTRLAQIGSNLSKNIQKIDYADYEGKKPIFSNCVQFAFSKEIDSIAKEEYKKAINTKSKYID
jgi:hypothetical protein